MSGETTTEPGNDVGADAACPRCGNRDADRLPFIDDECSTVCCFACGLLYEPLPAPVA